MHDAIKDPGWRCLTRMRPSIDNYDTFICGNWLILVFLMAQLNNSQIKPTCWFADNGILEFKRWVNLLDLILKAKKSLLQKRVSIRNAGSKEDFILIVLELILEAQVKEGVSFLDSILVGFLFFHVFNLDSSRFPFFLSLDWPYIRFHASLKQRILLLKPVNVKFYCVLDSGLDREVKPLAMSSSICVNPHVQVVLIVSNPNIIRFLLRIRCSSYPPKILNWNRCLYWSSGALDLETETRSLCL